MAGLPGLGRKRRLDKRWPGPLTLSPIGTHVHTQTSQEGAARGSWGSEGRAGMSWEQGGVPGDGRASCKGLREPLSHRPWPRIGVGGIPQAWPKLWGIGSQGRASKSVGRASAGGKGPVEEAWVLGVGTAAQGRPEGLRGTGGTLETSNLRMREQAPECACPPGYNATVPHACL